MNRFWDGSSVSVWIFWISVLFVLYTYGIYPILLALLARLRPRPVARRAPDEAPSISVVVAVFNEAENMRRRVSDLLAQDYPAERVRIVLVSDGSTDETPEVLEQLQREEERVEAIVLEQNRGKAVALNAGVEAAHGELIVFTDARQRFAPDVLTRLAENFADPAVGSASGELVLTDTEAGVAAQVGLYWRYEKWIRRNESAVGSMLGATGAIYAIRRDLYQPLPEGTLLDDFLTPMRIVLRGRRALFDASAVAFDRPSLKASQEFRRKVRTLAGNFQAFASEPGMLLPWRNPTTCFQVWSHKLMRLLVPYALVLVLVGSIGPVGWFYRLALCAQILFYVAAGVGWGLERAGRTIGLRSVNLAYTFVTLNLAAVGGLIHWLRGKRASNVWRKAYHDADE